MTLKTGLAPIVRSDARLLILGSLPGDASLAASQYYAHARNQFWALMSGVIGLDLVAMSYRDRTDAILQAKIALWDVVEKARRPGSLDQHIHDIQINDVIAIARSLPDLQAVAFNGQKAASLGGKIFTETTLDVINLPSSSAAYTLSVERKYAIWSGLTPYLDAGEKRTCR